jgi:hypothetical protein
VTANCFTAIILFSHSKKHSIDANELDKRISIGYWTNRFSMYFLYKIKQTKKQLEHIGNLVTISPMGATFLLPLLLLQTQS